MKMANPCFEINCFITLKINNLVCLYKMYTSTYTRYLQDSQPFMHP